MAVVAQVVTAEPASAPELHEALNRIEQLQAELQQLRGSIEEQSHKIAQLKKRQNNIYNDLDLRLQAITNLDTNKTQPALPTPQAASAITKTSDNKQSDTKTNAAPPTQATTVVPAPVAKPNTAPQAPLQSTNLLPPTPTDKITATTTAPTNPNKTQNTDKQPAIDEKALYNAAHERLKNSKNERAIALFKSVIAKFPNGEYADNSQYWLGEAYKVNQNIDLAKAAFAQVLTDYPTSAKAPDALLKLGMIALEERNTNLAEHYLNKVVVNYPQAESARLARNKLNLMGIKQP